MSTSRLAVWQTRSAKLFVRSCRWAMVCMVAWMVVIGLELLGLSRVLDSLLASESVWAQLVSVGVLLITVAVPLCVPFIAMAFLVLSMAVGKEPSAQELRWSWLAWIMCAIGLLMVVLQQSCTAATSSISNCRAEAVWFVLDQFNHGSFGDVFDVFDISFSSMDFSALSGWAKFNALVFRMLCGVCVVSLLMLWLAQPLERLAQTNPLQAAYRMAHRVFLWASYASLLCLAVWIVVLLLDVLVFPGFFTALDANTSWPALALKVLLLLVLAAVPVVVPLVSLAYLVLALIVGQALRGRDMVWTTFLLLLCAAGLGPILEGSVCQGTAAEIASCAEQIPGFVIDQFYKGAFADIFDVYELKLGDVSSDAMSLTDKLMILNFRLLCAVYVVGVLVAFGRWREARRQRRQAEREPAAGADPEAQDPSDWPKTVFAETLPMRR